MYLLTVEEQRRRFIRACISLNLISRGVCTLVSVKNQNIFYHFLFSFRDKNEKIMKNEKMIKIMKKKLLNVVFGLRNEKQDQGLGSDPLNVSVKKLRLWVPSHFLKIQIFKTLTFLTFAFHIFSNSFGKETLLLLLKIKIQTKKSFFIIFSFFFRKCEGIF